MTTHTVLSCNCSDLLVESFQLVVPSVLVESVTNTVSDRFFVCPPLAHQMWGKRKFSKVIVVTSNMERGLQISGKFLECILPSAISSIHLSNSQECFSWMITLFGRCVFNSRVLLWIWLSHFLLLSSVSWFPVSYLRGLSECAWMGRPVSSQSRQRSG